MSKGQYPNMWRRKIIQKRVRQLANHQCEECGMEFVPGTNLAKTAKNRVGKPIIGTVHHIDHNRENCCMDNLVYLCQKCHYTLHLYNWQPGDYLLLKWQNQAPRWMEIRGIPYKYHPQMRLI